MTEFLILANEQSAQSRSRAIALQYGCGPVTLFWFGWRVHPSDGRAALAIPDRGPEGSPDTIHGKGRDRLSGAERDALVRELPAEWEPEDGQRTR